MLVRWAFVAAATRVGLLCLTSSMAAAGPEEKSYVGSETFLTCHVDIFTGLRKNPHHVIETSGLRGRWKGQACESCHGRGSKHAESASAEDIINPGKLSGVSRDKQCLTCHLNRSTHTGRIFGSHARGQVSCATCHSVHRNGSADTVARRVQDMNRLCSGCHTSTWAEFRKPHAHRLPENAMSCIRMEPHNHSSFGPSPATKLGASRVIPISAAHLRLSMHQCGSKAAEPATSPTAHRTRAC
jgi:DmsE family decaheme c-type cytochrome